MAQMLEWVAANRATEIVNRVRHGVIHIVAGTDLD